MNALLLIVTAALLSYANRAAAFDVFLPPAGEDVLPATKATLMVDMGGAMELRCSGPTRIRRGDPVVAPVPYIETEMVQLDLSCGNGIMVHLDPRMPSPGQTSKNGDSFFDIFVEITVPGTTPVVLHNCSAPARMQATVGHVPPLGSVYYGANQVDLCDQSNQPLARLTHVEHEVNGVPKPESSGEVSEVFSCFYECKKDPRSTDWLEITSLMLINQTADVTLTAEVLVINGNETPVGKFRTRLSPLDLDEINICATLDLSLGQNAVPPAGVIEVSLAPTGGAYGWVKNLLGRFRRSDYEPFGAGQLATGVGKTECRLVGPNVTTARKLRAISAPVLQRVYIENTADPKP
ncbi:MAG: hypothetical protein HY699_01835 [Deltaproteobacteria bacterium]|nr:hypothetical protein [Deltaproteobacteria bacterium]